MTLFLIVICVYFGAVNIWGFILMGMDKHRAERNIWRISEFTLFIPAFFGGALGCILGMNFFHHKTKHMKFVIGLPLVLFLQLAALGWVLFLSPWSFSFM